MALYDEYAGETKAMVAEASQLGQYQPPTARRQLEQKMAALKAEAEKVQKALDALDAHPDLESFTETLKAALR